MILTFFKTNNFAISNIFRNFAVPKLKKLVSVLSFIV